MDVHKEFKIRRTEGSQIIVEEARKKPVVYESLSSAVVDLFHPLIQREFIGKDELSVIVDFTFNPPISKP